MKKRLNNSTRASALQIALSVALLSSSAFLLASSFKAAPAPVVAPKAFGAVSADLVRSGERTLHQHPILLAMLNPVPKERDPYLRVLQARINPAPREEDQYLQAQQELQDLVYRPEAPGAPDVTGRLAPDVVALIGPIAQNQNLRNLPDIAATPRTDLQARLTRYPHDQDAPQGRWDTLRPIIESAMHSSMPSPLLTFGGMSQEMAGGPAAAGPDVSGDVGPRHYIQSVNSSIRIHDKKGSVIAGPISYNAFFSALGSSTPCGSNLNQGQGTVFYDHMADRWVVSDVAYSSFPGNAFYQCVGVSKTSDPVAGGWYLYAVQIDSSNARLLGDSPRFGLWPDAYYMSVNLFSNQSTFNGVRVFAFDRRSMINGGPANTVAFNIAPAQLGDAYSLVPVTFRAGSPPPALQPAYFMAINSSRVAGTVEHQVHAWRFHADFANPANSTFGNGVGHARDGAINVNSFVDAFTVPTSNIIPNGSGIDRLDAVGDRLMSPLVYQNLNGAESIYGAHTINNNQAGTGPTAIRWYQFNVTGNAIPAGAAQQQSFNNNNDGLWRWLPSMNVDGYGNVAVGYSASTPNAFGAGIRYAGRLTTDSANDLARGEAVLMAGSGSSNTARWGSYSATMIDPADSRTFWHTNQYYSAAGRASDAGWSTRIGAFKYPGFAASAVPAGQPAGWESTASGSGTGTGTGTGPGRPPLPPSMQPPAKAPDAHSPNALLTTLIDPTGDGGFESGFGGWTVVNGATDNRWFTGTAAGASVGTKAAFIGSSATTYTDGVAQTVAVVDFIYKDITFPAGETAITLTFDYKQPTGDTTFDLTRVFLVPTSTTPVAGTVLSSGQISTDAQGQGPQATFASRSITIAGANAGTTQRLVFQWKNDAAAAYGSGAIDNISLVSAVPVPISGTKTVGTGGDFVTLTAAFAYLSINGVNGPLVLELLPGYTSGSETFPITASNFPGNSATNTITVRPQIGATARSITGSNTTAIVDLNGAQNVIFDGRPGGTGTAKELTISNTSTATGGTSVRFINDAISNRLQYVILKSLFPSSTSGVVVFSTTTGATGNDNNTIDNCDIDGGAGATVSPTLVAQNGVFSSGTTTTVPQNNSGNTISNCNIFNNFVASGATSAGILLSTGNTDWTITGNSIYQTAARTATTAVTVYGISIANSTSGNNFVVSSNFIGGSAASAGGTPWNVGPNTLANRFNGIGLSVATTTPSSVQGNTVANFVWLSNSSATANSTSSPLGTGVWGGIYIGAGSANIGTTTGNVVGSGTGTGSISVTVGTNAGATANGYGCSGSGTVNISNNTVGSITTSGATPAISTGIIGVNSNATGNITISGNTIGSTTTANSLNASLAGTGTTAQVVTGIISTGAAAAASITNNTIANANNAYVPTVANASSVLRGIFTSGLNINTITGNTIRNLSTAAQATGTGSTASVIGIGQTSTTAGQTVSQNTIHSLSNSHATAAVNVVGLVYSGPITGTNLIARNFIHSLSTTSTAALQQGINVAAGASTYQNNMVRLGVDAAGASITTSAAITGILKAATDNNNFYFNSVFIGGTGVASGAVNTFGFSRTGTGTDDFRDNIIVNNRSNASGTGKHYEINLSAITTFTSDYNVFNQTGTGAVFGVVAGTDSANFGAWKNNTNQDANSAFGDPQFLTPNGTSATVDLHIHPTNPTAVEGAGVLIASVTDDFDGQTRASFTPVDIGADAGNFTALDQVPPAISYAPLQNSTSTTTRSFTGVIVTDASGVNGTLGTRPRVYYKRSGDANTFNDNTSGTAGWKFAEANGSTSPFDFTIDYSLIFGGSVSAGDSIQYFVVAQDNAATPNVGINSGIFNAQPASVALTAGAFPITGTIRSYLIAATAFSGTVTVGSGGTYPTLTGAGGFFAAVNVNVLTGNVTVNIVSDITEDGTNALNEWSEDPGGSNFTMTIQPDSTTERVISGSVANGMIRLNGADRVTITSPLTLAPGNPKLKFRNDNGSNPALTFLNGATNNTITNCTIESRNATVTSGTIYFSTTNSVGNSNNTISNCLIKDSSGLGGTPANAIYSLGTAATPNSTNTISGNYIQDYFSATAATAGINVSATGNSAWTITDNKLFQTSTRVYTTAATHRGIFVGTGSGYTITGNTIGFADATGAGTTNMEGITTLGTFSGTFPTSYTLGTATLNATLYIAIDCAFTAGGTVSNIQNNTIAGIALLTSSGATASPGILCGINVTSGNANIGTTTANTIGATSGGGGASASSLYAATTTSGGTVVGINASSTNTVTIQNNTIGSVDAVGTTTTTSGAFTGVDAAGTGGVFNISTNTIGSTTANNIRTGYTLSGGSLSNSGTITSTTGTTSPMVGIRHTATGATVTINSNTLQGWQNGTTSGGQLTGITSTGSVTSSATINSNQLGTSSQGWINYPFANTFTTSTALGINLTGSGGATSHSIQSNDFRGITFTTSGAMGLTFITLTGATAANDIATIASNTFTNLNVNTTGSVTFISHNYSEAATGTLNLNSNSIVTAFNKGGAGGSVTVTTTGAFSAAGSILNQTGNNFSNITVTGATSITGFSNIDGTVGTIKTITGNTLNNWTGGTSSITGMSISYINGASSISSNTITNLTGQSSITGLTISSSQNTGSPLNVSSNTITGLSSTGTGGSVTGLSCSNTSPTINISSNTINTLSSTGASSTVAGITITGAATTNVSGNTINTLSGTGTTSPVANGLSVSSGTTVNVFKNKICDVAENGAISATSPAVNGMLFSGGTTVTAYDNLIGDLRAPAASLTDAIRGISVTSTTATTTYNVYYNTAYLAASSTATTFGTTGVFHAANSPATTASLNLRNNVIVNNSTPGTTAGLTVAYRRSGTDLTNYASTSNNNDFYAGTPGVSNLIFNDGTNSDQSMAAYKARVGPRDSASFSENPTFLSTTCGNANFLRPDPAVQTAIESGGANVTGITDDYAGTIRQGNAGYSGTGTAPDVGAWEFEGIAAPQMVYSSSATFQNSNDVYANTTNQNVVLLRITTTGISQALSLTQVTCSTTGTTNLADISNAKLFYNGGNSTFNPNSPGIQYGATILAPSGTLMFTGSQTLSTGDNYFWLTYDIPMGATGGNVVDGTFTNFTLSDGFGSRLPDDGGNPAGARIIRTSIPPGKTLVGSGQSYPFNTLTNAIQALNAVGITGNTIYSLTDPTYSVNETFPIVINAIPGAGPTAGFTLKPDTGVMPLITGSSAVAILKLNGASYVTIDGSNSGGTSRDLSIKNTNTSTTSQVVWLASTTVPVGSTNNTIKNCKIAGNTSITTQSCITSSGSSAGAVAETANSNNTYQNNQASLSFSGMAWVGPTGGESGTVITQNSVGTATEALGFRGMHVANQTSPTITSNTVRNVVTTSSTAGAGGIALISATTPNVSNNTLRDISSSAAASGTSSITALYIDAGSTTANVNANTITGIVSTTTSGYGARGIINLANGTTISNNSLSDIYCFQDSSNIYWPIGIDIDGASANVNVWFNSVNLFGSHPGYGPNTTGGAAPAMFINTTAATPNLDIRDNIFASSYDNTTSSGDKAYAIYSTKAATAFTMINSNDYYASGPGSPVLGSILVGATQTDEPTLLAWQGATGQDGGSIAADPLFNTSTNLQPQPGSPVLGAGMPAGGITTDLNGNPRSGTNPTIGAYETAVDSSAPVISYTPLPNTTSTANRALATTITDSTGVPTAGIGLPRIGYKKNAGSYVYTTATYGGGSTYNFTIDNSMVGGVVVGDTISYFVVAQDTAVPPNVGSNPSAGAGYTASPPTASPPPTTPNSYTIAAAISGIKTVCPFGCDYTSLTNALGAFADINAKVVTGNIEIQIQGDSTAEDGTNALNSLNEEPAGSGFTVKIYPTGTNISNQPAVLPRMITGSNSGGLIRISGGRNVSIDGSLNGTGTDQSMIISQTNAGTASAVIWLQTSGVNGAANNTIKNCKIAGNSNTTTLFGIGSGSATISTSSLGTGNSNNTFQNNNISKTQYGIYSQGASSANKNTGNVITQNSINTASPDNVQFGAIWVGFENNITISSNNVGNLSTTLDIFGITVGLGNSFTTTTTVGNEVTNATVSKNIVNSVVSTSTTGFTAIGIGIGAQPSGSTTTVSNNMVSNVISFATSPDFISGIHLGGGAGTTNVYFNSVYLTGSKSSGTSGGTYPGYALSVGGTTPVVDIRDNLLENTQTSGNASPGKSFAIGLAYTSTLGNYANLTSNYNDFFVSGPQGVLTKVGSLNQGTGTEIPTLSGWQTETGRDPNSFASDPLFTSTSNLHIPSSSPAINAGLPAGGITTDIDGDTRNGSTPDVGADEVVLPVCGTSVGGTATVPSGTGPFCGSTVVSLADSGYSPNGIEATGGPGFTYQWQSSSDMAFTTPNNLPGQTNPSSASGGTITSTTYFRLRVFCSNGGSEAFSNVVSVTITPLPTASATPSGSTTVCEPNTVLLTSSTNASSPTYQWQRNGVDIGGATSSTYTASTSGSYTVKITDGTTSCFNTSNAVSVTVNPQPSAVTITPPSVTMCTGDPAQLLTASGGTIGSTGGATIGAGATTEFSSSPYRNGANASKQQYLFTAAELSGAGISGNFTSISYFITSNGSPTTLDNYQISMAPTNATSLGTTFLTTGDVNGTGTFTVTYGPTSYTTVAGDNLHTFTTPFSWDGTSNVVVQICHEVTSPFGSSTVKADAISGRTTGVAVFVAGSQCATTSGAATSPNRPTATFSFNSSVATNITWSPTTGLYTEPSATTPYTGGATNTVYARPTSTTTYTATATSGASCTNSNTVRVTVNNPGTVSGATPLNTGQMTTYTTSGSADGTWSSTNTSVATVDSSSGVVTAVGVGTTDITYSFGGSCSAFQTLTVNATVSGTITNCSNPASPPVPSVTMTLSGDGSGTTMTNGSGQYTFTSLAPGMNYTITPSKTDLIAGDPRINVNDITAIVRHILGATPLTGCRLTAADVNNDSTVNVNDITAVVRFVLGSTNTANTGKYSFTPTSRSYPNVSADHPTDDYTALVFGDVAAVFTELTEAPQPSGAEKGGNVATAALAGNVVLPNQVIDSSGDVTVAVTTSKLDEGDKLVGFQGDFTFDSAVVSVQSVPVQKGGLTEGNWTVVGNVISSGPGTIKTLRVLGFSNNQVPLSGSGTLFELRMKLVKSKAGARSPLIWSGQPNHFRFVDADLQERVPVNTPPGSVTLGRSATGRK